MVYMAFRFASHGLFTKIDNINTFGYMQKHSGTLDRKDDYSSTRAIFA